MLKATSLALMTSFDPQTTYRSTKPKEYTSLASVYVDDLTYSGSMYASVPFKPGFVESTGPPTGTYFDTPKSATLATKLGGLPAAES